MFVSGVTFQSINERNKAPFPPCPRDIQDKDSDLRSLLQARQNRGVTRQNCTSTEREPLIRGGSNVQYGTVGSDEEENSEDQYA